MDFCKAMILRTKAVKKQQWAGDRAENVLKTELQPSNQRNVPVSVFSIQNGSYICGVRICVPLLLSLSWQNDMDRIIIIEFWGQRWILMMPHHIEYRWRNGHEMHTQNRTQHSHSNAIMGHRLDNIHSYHIIKIWFSRKWWYRNERYLMKMRCMGHH